jgi:hypothetical protein
MLLEQFAAELNGRAFSGTESRSVAAGSRATLSSKGDKSTLSALREDAREHLM